MTLGEAIEFAELATSAPSAGTARWRRSHGRAVARAIGRVEASRLAGREGALYLHRLAREWRASGLAARTVTHRIAAIRLALRASDLPGPSIWPRATDRARGEAPHIPLTRWISVEDFWLLHDRVGDVARTMAGADLDRAGAEDLVLRRRGYLIFGMFCGVHNADADTQAWRHFRSGAWLRRNVKNHGNPAPEWLPLPPPLADWLSTRIPGSPDSPVFGPWPRVDRALARACVAIGIMPVNYRDFRRSCATHLATAGEREDAIARWLGHTSTDMVREVYRQVAPIRFESCAAAFHSRRQISPPPKLLLLTDEKEGSR